MSWFSKKSSSDTKARIEELKKKIQAEQTAYAQSVAAPPPPAAPPAPSTVLPDSAYAPPAMVLPPAPSPNPVPSMPPAAVPTPPIIQPVAQSVQPVEFSPREFPPRQSHRHESRHEPRHDRTPVERSASDVWQDRAPREQPRHHEHDVQSGVILDLGEGMSLNLPIRGKMQLDEFLLVAQRVRELQRLERTH